MRPANSAVLAQRRQARRAPAVRKPRDLPRRLGGICRTDAAGNPLYRINLVDDIDEPPTAAINPWQDLDEVFLIRAECLSADRRRRRACSTACRSAAPDCGTSRRTWCGRYRCG